VGLLLVGCRKESASRIKIAVGVYAHGLRTYFLASGKNSVRYVRAHAHLAAPQRTQTIIAGSDIRRIYDYYASVCERTGQVVVGGGTRVYVYVYVYLRRVA